MAKRKAKTKTTQDASTPPVCPGEQAIALETLLPADAVEAPDEDRLLCLGLPALVEVTIPLGRLRVEDVPLLRSLAVEASIIQGPAKSLATLKRKLWCRIRHEKGATWQAIGCKGLDAGMTDLRGQEADNDFSEEALEELFDHLLWHCQQVMQLARRLARKRESRLVGPKWIREAAKRLVVLERVGT